MKYEELQELVEYMFEKMSDSIAEARALREMLADYKVISDSELELRIKDIKTEDFLKARAAEKAAAVAKAFRDGRIH
ncbi:MAG: hypothetical protein V4502_08135 [Pseudomonadota bacterium]